MKRKSLLTVLFCVLSVTLSCLFCLQSVAFAVEEEIEEYPGTNISTYRENTNVYGDLTWQYANTGSNAKGSYHTGSNGEIIIEPESGKGKIADSEEGFCFYYTKIDAAKENFYVEATFTITSIKPDNQNGFGLICTDTVGTQNTGRYMNYVAMGCYKLGGSNYNLPGGRTVWGYTSPDGTSPSEDATGAGDSLRQSSVSTLAFDDTTMAPAQEIGLTYRFALRKSNTGYHCFLLESPEGKGCKEKLYYNTAKLLSQDMDYVYIGFFASRNVSVSVSDVFMTVVDSATDERKYDEPPTAIPLVLSVFSPSSRGTLEYNYSALANAPGTLEVVDKLGNTYIEGQHLDANEMFTKSLNLPERNYINLISRYYPDSSRIDAGVVSQSIYYYSLPNIGGVVYADPFVLERTGTGTKEDPVCLYDALQFALPGYTIILKDGVYKPVGKLSVERGVNGTSDKPITLKGETVGGVTFDFKNASCKNEAFWLAGDYWYVYGINFVNAPSSSKGLRVSGNYNVVELCTAHNNTNTGIQVSGNSKEGFICWPHDNLIKNCTSYENCDETRQDADGFAVKLTSGNNNKLYGCISYNNIDDGFDLYAKAVTGSIGPVTIENCVAYNNGYLPNEPLSDELKTGEGNGFKLGGESMPGRHKLVNCIAFGNGAKGITSNSGPDVIIENCTIYKNNVFAKHQEGVSNENVSLYAKRPAQTTNFEVKGLISIADADTKVDKFALHEQADIVSADNYLWNGSQSQNVDGALASEEWFISTDIENVNITRTEEGEINMNGLLELNDKAPLDSGAVFQYFKEGSPVLWIVAGSVGGAGAIAGVIVLILKKKAKV